MTTTDQQPPSTAADSTTVQVHRVYIKAPIQEVWGAVTSPAWSNRYGYGGHLELQLTPNTPWQTAPNDDMRQMGVTGAMVDGEVLEVDPPNRLVQTWRMAMDPGLAALGFTQLTYDLHEDAGVTRLTVTHDLTAVPQLALMVGGQLDAGAAPGMGGWPWVLSDLKSLLETGTAFTRPT